MSTTTREVKCLQVIAVKEEFLFKERMLVTLHRSSGIGRRKNMEIQFYFASEEKQESLSLPLLALAGEGSLLVCLQEGEEAGFLGESHHNQHSTSRSHSE